ncbi:MAG TPA: hypothetical protein VGW33_04210 [Terriglobia bacterium]|nr:hypothetical protein [Terriglobia bacterium]
MEETLEHGLGGFIGLVSEAEMARRALVSGQHSLTTVFSEEHAISFPVAGVGAVVDKAVDGLVTNHSAAADSALVGEGLGAQRA